MAVEIKVPQIGESITEVTIGDWLIKEGEAIEADKSIAVLESDKATMELPAQAAGTLTRILKKTGETAQVGEVIGIIDPDVAGVRPAQPLPNAPEAQSKAPKAEPTKASPPGPEPRSRAARETPAASPAPATPPLSTPSAPAAPAKRSVTPQAPPPPAKPAAAPPEFAAAPMEFAAAGGAEEEEVVPMTRLRRTIAKRLVDAQRNAALLTTFNEVDMSAVMDLRKQYGEAFLEKYQTKLGFMSFFVKAAIDALKLVPQVNAEIRGDDIVYKNHYDIAIAIGGGKGLVVPVLRNADRLSFAEVELAIADFAKRARANALRPDELQGGTFTITNGGIYGSLLSTPLVNPPQSGILGMHSIQDRPVARAGQVVIRPMMYIALTYDHRLVDGREAVTFLKRIKEGIEEPTRMLLEI